MLDKSDCACRVRFTDLVLEEAWEPQMKSVQRHIFRPALVLAISACTMTQSTWAQSNTCGMAVSQLQHYVSQVNAVANSEYYQGIPMRCGVNPNCMAWWLQQLNAWYMQQSAMVNNWYAQLSHLCTSNRPSGGVRVNRTTRDTPGGLDKDAVDELEVDDEDKSVAIKIPSNPRGFR